MTDEDDAAILARGDAILNKLFAHTETKTDFSKLTQKAEMQPMAGPLVRELLEALKIAIKEREEADV